MSDLGLKLSNQTGRVAIYAKKVISMSENRKILAKNPLEGLFGKLHSERGYLAKALDI